MHCWAETVEEQKPFRFAGSQGKEWQLLFLDYKIPQEKNLELSEGESQQAFSQDQLAKWIGMNEKQD